MTLDTLRAAFARIRAFALGLAMLAVVPAGSLAAERGVILVYGDSLSAAYGISQKDGWVALLQQRLRKNRFDYTVANASISGETSSGGRSRISATLAQHKPEITVLALGANDGLRGLPVSQMRDNLGAIVGAAQRAGSKVLLVGMKMPPNYGPVYVRDFEEAFKALARRHRLALVPFLLEGIVDRAELFQADRLHPNAQAQPILLENVWRALRPMLPG